MLDDIRKDHDPLPSAEERDWLAGDMYGAFSRVVVLIGIAMMVGLGASALLDGYLSVPPIASSGAAAPAASPGATR